MTRWDDLREAERDCADRRLLATTTGHPDLQLDAERAERRVARMQMGDDVDD